ncbi:glycosyltransferase family 4 protein [Chitinophaga varians]|uniref:glycosyltransferase family 4 protein n=1 Tax=Chitinophaga varians TaxID=2202339 RepID=UPI00165F168E|nr:glycosyltransferase family 4 protein [Chitinophaga varians]MBC9910589.1 glycosyltransferase family 4 protein [Chitinophaga varians]
MKKILFIGHRDMFFGAESVLFRIISHALGNKAAEVSVVLPYGRSNGFREALRETENVSVIRSPFRLVNPRALLSLLIMLWNNMALLQLWVVCRRKRINVIYSNTCINIIGPLLAWILNIEHIWHFHEQPTGGSFRWIPAFLYPLYRKLLKRRQNLVVFISHQQKELWEKEFGITIPRSVVIYTPARFLRKQEVPVRQAVVFGFLGSFTRPKNILPLINCFGTLQHKYPEIPARLHIMGGGEQKGEIMRTIQALGLDGQVSVLPHSRDVDDFFAGIDIFVLPSDFESWGLVAMEAMSIEIPTIITSNTSLTEILTHREDTVFIDPAQPDELLRAMEEMLIQQVFRDNIAKRGYQKLKALNLEAAFEKEVSKLLLV